jgi:hypothetical protein
LIVSEQNYLTIEKTAAKAHLPELIGFEMRLVLVSGG